MKDCRKCKEWLNCPNGKSGHDKRTSYGYSRGECKDYEEKKNENNYTGRI